MLQEDVCMVVAVFLLEKENRLGRETRLQANNSSDMNSVKDDFAVSNFSVCFSFKTDGKIRREIRLRQKTVLNSH